MCEPRKLFTRAARLVFEAAYSPGSWSSPALPAASGAARDLADNHHLKI